MVHALETCLKISIIDIVSMFNKKNILYIQHNIKLDIMHCQTLSLKYQ